MEGLAVNRITAVAAVCAIMALLTACGHEKPILEKPIITYVEKRIECPSKEERARLQQLRPTPLRKQPMPSTAVERDAKAQAQLGLYEADGGYADQVDSALNRCQTR
jgi:hypothetical protein